MHSCEEDPVSQGSETFPEDEEPCSEKAADFCQLHNPPSPPEIEKQIAVDPLSLRELPQLNDEPVSIPVVSTVSMVHSTALPPLRKPKFVSASLPCSATSSPQYYGSVAPKAVKKWNEPPNQAHPLARQQSVALSRFAPKQNATSLSRSKSCREGRSSVPADEFDILSRKPSTQRYGSGSLLIDESAENSSYYKELPFPPTRANINGGGDDDNFKCGALCLYLPAFSKRKPVQLSTSSRSHEQDQPRASTISRAFSLEKFECASWSSPGILIDNFGVESSGSFFDLPMELIRCSNNETDSPVRTAFLFDSDRKGGMKKSSTSRLAPGKSSHEFSNRRGRASVSGSSSHSPSPSAVCITPRLRKARAEFNAFLEAQSA
ncbi:uncharacterized protein LOC109714825 [Ananas comosus]|uniref:Uncharacterized protein LOC109714825 n=1 Tax=Ananas comosus TaxID=4615 RepID=A0A6P5FHP7_ANACO|nr:uncharacterized protein LOC109714825 [Ananas comosus]